MSTHVRSSIFSISVAKKNLEFLQEVEEQPHIDIEEANPRLYDHVVEIQEIKVSGES